jgi:aprataxin
MSKLTVLRSYAIRKNPEMIPASILFSHSPSTLTIFDAYPKAIFHFLILLRPTEKLSVLDLASLRTLLRQDKDSARLALETLLDECENLIKNIREEMRERYGFVWDVHAGFHAVPSMEYAHMLPSGMRILIKSRHIHLHVISSDLTSQALKTKKHYNSFHPKLGFFLPLDKVISWLDAVPEKFDEVRLLTMLC